MLRYDFDAEFIITLLIKRKSKWAHYYCFDLTHALFE